MLLINAFLYVQENNELASCTTTILPLVTLRTDLCVNMCFLFFSLLSLNEMFTSIYVIVHYVGILLGYFVVYLCISTKTESKH